MSVLTGTLSILLLDGASNTAPEGIPHHRLYDAPPAGTGASQ